MVDQVQDILRQAEQIEAQYPSADSVLSYLGNQVVTRSPNTSLVAETPEMRGSHFLDQCHYAIHKAVCDDFAYCSKRDEVDSNINKYLPDIIKALIKEKAGATGPSWLIALLGVFGIATWEAAVAGIAVYAVKTGLNQWCACGK